MRLACAYQLRGREIGTSYTRPFRITLHDGLREGTNKLVIEVPNLMANCLLAMNRAGEPWRNFFFVNIVHQALDASGWQPLPSGLLGPLQLVSLDLIQTLMCR